MDQIEMLVIKPEFYADSSPQFEGRSTVTGDTTTSRPLSTTQSVSSQFAPTPSNHPTTSTSRSFNENNPNIASFRGDSRQDLVKKVERNNINNCPSIAARNKIASICAQLQQTNTALPFNFESQSNHQPQEQQLTEMNAKVMDNRKYEALDKKYGKLKLNYFEFKTSANMKLDTLQTDNDKLKDEIQQLKEQQVTLMAQIKTPTETSQPIEPQLMYIKEEIVDDSDVNEMQIKSELSDDDNSNEDWECNQFGVKRELDQDGVDNDGTVKQQRNERGNDEDGRIEDSDTEGIDNYERGGHHGSTGDTRGEGQLLMNVQVDGGDDDHVEPVNAIQQPALNTNQPIPVARTVFKCDFPGCGKVCAQRGNLKAHRRVHTREKPFKCAFTGCAKAFSQSSTLRYHERVHSGKGSHVCDWPNCGSSFSQKQYLTRHKRQVHGAQ